MYLIDCFFSDNDTCEGYFKCHNNRICLPHSAVCDGIRHCPEGDDEKLCSPDPINGCEEFLLSYKCPGSNATADGPIHYPSFPLSTRQLDFSGRALGDYFNRGIFNLPLLLTFNLRSCSIRNLQYNASTSVFIFLVNLKTLDLSDNLIQIIHTNTFSSLKYLKSLDLSGNNLIGHIENGGFYGLQNVPQIDLMNTQLKEITKGLFEGLANLDNLTISSEKLQNIEEGAFSSLSTITYLDIRNNSNLHVTMGMFVGLRNLDSLYADSYGFCCVKPKSVSSERCFAPTDSIASCEHLIGIGFLRILVWVMGVFALVGNTAVLIYRIAYDRERLKQTFAILIINLGVSDFLMGVYLIIIGGVNIRYEGEFVYYEREWRDNWLCTFCGVVSAISSETSVLLIFLITVDRFIAVKYPFKMLKRRTIQICCVFAWVASIAVAVAPLVIESMPGLKNSTDLPGFYTGNSVCVALPITSDKNPGWTYSVAVYIVFNFFVFLFVAIGQLIIYLEVRRTSSRLASNRQLNEGSIARSLLAVVATDFCCWCPIGILGKKFRLMYINI